MTEISKRGLLLALVAIGGAAVSGGTMALAQAADPMLGVDREGAAEIARAWLARNRVADAKALVRDLFPSGAGAAALAALASRVRADFQAGRMFECRGWRLSDTEGRLCAALQMI